MGTTSDWGRRKDMHVRQSMWWTVPLLLYIAYACYTGQKHVSHQPFNLQGEEGGEEEDCPNERTDD